MRSERNELSAEVDATSGPEQLLEGRPALKSVTSTNEDRPCQSSQQDQQQWMADLPKPIKQKVAAADSSLLSGRKVQIFDEMKSKGLLLKVDD
mmetsp:Transcript_25033/g.33564  ORF Transcript_25033/g.33564 Transcript_25033/m.33564 type:complete len:93 (-) Transcript_25033:163-441(-)|eukprot:CAMPEP_0185587656 /NCGR_PEP_ID=MMETSP0434-20130131/49979_1 /TAXON_ID=626734 ORGANISM="Favella taraikaensis, Strain Fe Narragansett Bay" /NCGR_SAMPLE_ID=MMETSP0434 /ASSEMBLY_ACC=CAM_ASM_000379 /LENGTH=92 /DNA_ID=CAMNT_0028209709 /DNA_START=706 /DNA_END=984 /DNA_ORIENTATION=-